MKDLTGQKFGRLTVLEETKGRKGYWHCKCNCGTIKDVRRDHLLRGETLSCGCLHKEHAKEIGSRNSKDYTGFVNEWMTVIEPLGYSTSKGQNKYWRQNVNVEENSI